jgi:phosphatidylglycerophosphate synthase
VVEAGELAEDRVTGPAGVAAALVSATQAHDGALCLVDAASLALPTTYGDVVADPRDQPAVLHDEESGRALAVRVDAATLADAGALELLGRALRGAPPGAALTVLAGAISAAGRPVLDLSSGDFPVHTVVGPGDLTYALDRDGAADEAALRLRRASRADDGFLSTFLVRPVSRRLTRRAVALGLRPDAVTAVSCLLGLLAAGAYAGGSLSWRVAGSVLLLVSLVVDCVDGEVARYTRTFTPLGGWLDVGSDRLKEYAVYAGLAWGASPHIWGLAAAAFAVLVVRHFVDFGYAQAVARGSKRSGGRVSALSERTSGRPALRWAKRAVVMPVGERTIVLAVLAPILGARWALIVLLVAGCVAAAYTLAGRLGRMVTARGKDRVRWLEPAAARAVEQGGLALLVGVHRPGALPGAYLLLAAVALHQYDVVYRRRLTGAVGEPADPGSLGRVPWPARVVVVAVLAVVLPATPLGWVLAALGAVLALAAVADSGSWWRSFVRSGL